MSAIKNYLSFFMFISLVLGINMSCGNQQKKESAVKTENVAIGIDDLLANISESVDKVVQIEGVCTHICQHGGTKIFLMGDDEGKTIRVEAGEKIGSFKPETVNSIVRVSGICKKESIDEALVHEGHEHDHAMHNTAEGEVCEAEQAALLSYYFEAMDYSIVVNEN